MKIAKIVAPTLAVVSGVAVLGTGIAAYADTSSSTNSTSSSSTSSQTDRPNNDPQKKDGGVITTDETVVSAVTSAVTAKYSGATVDRVAKLPDGSYLAFSRQSSGAKTIVSLSSSYAVTSTKDVPSGMPPSSSSSTTNNQ